MKRSLWLLAPAVALAMGAALPASAARTPSPASPTTPATAPSDTDAPNFLSVCRFSHRAPDDPIVFRGRPGASHSHDFMGNSSTNAFSMYQSMRAAGTSCRTSDDTAGYWVPTLYQDGVVVTPLRLNAYYRTAGKQASSIKAFPAGLEVVAGDSHASGPQPLSIVRWDCGPGGGVKAQSTPPSCPAGRLHLAITFPDCWNGKDLDSADHKSHLSYSKRGVCDTAHPVAVPRLVESITYRTTGGSGVTLASGSATTAHADFFNTWNQQRLEGLVHDCLNAMKHCGAVS